MFPQILRRYTSIRAWTCHISIRYHGFNTYKHALFRNKTAPRPLPLGCSGTGVTDREISGTMTLQRRPTPFDSSFSRRHLSLTCGVMSRALFTSHQLLDSMTRRSVSQLRTRPLFMLLCSSEHAKSLNIDWTMSVLPRLSRVWCTKQVKNFRILTTNHSKMHVSRLIRGSYRKS